MGVVTLLDGWAAVTTKKDGTKTEEPPARRDPHSRQGPEHDILTLDEKANAVYSARNGYLIEPNYFDLKTLGAYSSCSIRWLRDRLVDRMHPLPHHRVEGKLLVKKDDFDQWIEAYRVCQQPQELNRIVDDVLSDLFPAQDRA